MVLLPSLIHDDLDRERIVNGLAKPVPKRNSGVVVLAPSFARTADWKALGATVVDKNTVWDAIAALKAGQFENTVVLVNRYDGIDLPDETCRVLVFDSLPYSESLVDLYQERCRPQSESTLTRTIRSIEQGMGRSVRGEKDYSVIVAIGTELVRVLRDKRSRQYLSPQMAAQIEIGLEIAGFARQEIEEGKTAVDAFNGLIRQSRSRDVDWKAYYTEQMDKVSPRGANVVILKIFAAELAAEQLYISGDYAGASEELQKLLDAAMVPAEDSGWYLQERARYLYLANRPESQTLQVAAHKKNHLLLKPPTGVTVARLTVVSHGRVERVADWIRSRGGYAELNAMISDILGSLTFGTNANSFEHALDELSRALGFAGERPDAEWKEGPDNLWALDDRRYLLFECKSEVDITRAHVNKRETEQMNRSSAWFDKHYPGMEVRRFIIHRPAR